MEVGLVRKVDIDREMQQSYLDFAMSVIVARALPDARDGLKPVQRRILYAMYDMGLRADSTYKKSARIVGEVLGKYHPHGDMAVYEAMARMAQDFSMRDPLVDGQGNFGSVDGDPPAAMRYTEARLKPYALDMLSQLDRDTVKMLPNFDETMTEPEVLPAALPNLLVNGSTGIAVGMATNIPPHSLMEVVDALVYLLDQWEKLDDINVSDLMQFVKGPDFPTGGIILQDQTNDLLTAYATGRGRILVRGRVHMEDTGRGRSRLIITELPYMTNKSSLIERIAELVREGHLEGISDLRDESDRQGMRIVIELKQSANPEDILRDLFKRTPLETTIGITLLALVDGEPRLLSLKQALRVYLEHRLVVVRRRSEFDLNRARQRAHFLEGLRIAIANLDEVIKIIRAAPDVDTARGRLMKRFKLSEIQAQAILDMPLRRLAALERKKIEDEYKEVLKQIKDLETLLRSPKKVREVVQSELVQMKQVYGDRRRTQIVSLGEGDSARTMLTTTDLTEAEEAWVGVTADGLIARLPGGEAPKMAGREDPRWLVHTNSHHTLYLVTDAGQAAAVAVHALPEAGKASEGLPFYKACALQENDRLAALFSVPQRGNGGGDAAAEHFILTASASGLVKKSAIADLPGPSSQKFTLVKINPGDRLVDLTLTGGSDEIVLVTARGMAIRFAEQDVRAMGLVAAGVNGIKLAAGDQVVGSAKYQAGGELLLLASDGSGWRIKTSEFPLQGRYGMGVIACKPANGTTLTGLLAGKPSKSGVAAFSEGTSQEVCIQNVSMGKRQGAARRVLAVKAGDTITAVTSAWDSLAYWNPQPEIEEKPKSRRSAAKLPLTPVVEAPASPTPGNGKPARVKARTAESDGKAASPAKKPATKTSVSAAKKAGTSHSEKVKAKTPAGTGKSGEKSQAAVKPAKKPAAARSAAPLPDKKETSVKTGSGKIVRRKAPAGAATKTGAPKPVTGAVDELAARAAIARSLPGGQPTLVPFPGSEESVLPQPVKGKPAKAVSVPGESTGAKKPNRVKAKPEDLPAASPEKKKPVRGKTKPKA